MSDFATFFTGVLGFFAGQVAFLGVMRWIATLYTIAKSPVVAGDGGKALNIAMASIFGSGPWLLVAAVGGIVFVRDEPYATTLFVGAALGIAFMSSVALWGWRRIRANERSAAQSNRYSA
jgi:hypothetical protein